MQVKTFIRQPKRIKRVGKWRCGAVSPSDRMSKSSFPLGGRKGGFVLGSKWWWRVDEIDCMGTNGRLLIAFNLEKGNFLAWLGIERGSEHIIAACYEYHGDHPGFHWHTKCAPIHEFVPGCQRQRDGGVRIPRNGRYHRERPFDISQQAAATMAYKAFRITAKPEGAML